jgi:hypothetical protein
MDTTARIFLSSTWEDLKEDCRPSALRGIEKAEAVAVAMESWLGEFTGCAELCRTKIERDSSHYLGIIAYRRGWVPEGSDRSVTEMEFEWARAFEKRMAVLRPAGGSEFAAELRRRARDQSAEQQAAQEAFHNRLALEGYCRSFEDLADFEGTVTALAFLWNHRGLRRLAAEAETDLAGRPWRRILRLGRREQVRDFLRGVTLARQARPPRAVAFVVHGAPDAGQEPLLSRFGELLEENPWAPAPRRCRIDFSAAWRVRNVEQVFLLLARELGAEGVAGAPADLASRLRDCLALAPVVIEAIHVQACSGGVPGFVSEIWKPLIRSLGRTRHEIIALLTLSRPCSEAWRQGLHDLRAGSDVSFSGEVPILLPQLGPFSPEDLLDWLLERLPPGEAQALTDELLEETGGEPEALLRRLEALPFPASPDRGPARDARDARRS